MKPLKSYTLPDKTTQNYFGAKRKHDYHTGVDLFCNINEEVYSMYDGLVLSVIEFTGFNESPWWNNTHAVLIYHPEMGKTVLYGEVEPLVKEGDEIKKGTIVGKVLTVLKKDEGLPMTMLHIELYEGKQYDAVWWKHDEPQPNNLLDITDIL